jgi:hypothetical protein
VTGGCVEGLRADEVVSCETVDKLRVLLVTRRSQVVVKQDSNMNEVVMITYLSLIAILADTPILALRSEVLQIAG